MNNRDEKMRKRNNKKKMIALTHIFIHWTFCYDCLVYKHATPAKHAKQNNIFSSMSSKNFQENNEIMTSSRNDVNIWWLFFLPHLLGKIVFKWVVLLLILELLAFHIQLFSVCLVMLVFFLLSPLSVFAKSFLLQFCVPVIFVFPLTFVVYIFFSSVFDSFIAIFDLNLQIRFRNVSNREIEWMKSQQNWIGL